MKVFYSDKPLELLFSEHSIFLAGPTPRSTSVPSWRPDALKILESLNYQGQVIVPEHGMCEQRFAAEEFEQLYLRQVEWENYGLMNCMKIAFWVPRKIDTMPAFTTNVEFGLYVASSRIVYGRPVDSEKNRYLDWLFKKKNPFGIIHENLLDLMKAAML